jgi:hypothetical protein
MTLKLTLIAVLMALSTEVQSKGEVIPDFKTLKFGDSNQFWL